MTDQLFLSLWLPDALRNWRARYFEKMLSLFPFSRRDQPQSTLLIQGVGVAEPPLLERPMNGPVSVAEVVEILREYDGDDLGYRLETFWDLWRFSGEDWQIGPARVALCAFGPEFDSGAALTADRQEDLRIDFGVDTAFLPEADLPGSTKLVESNIKSLLRLVQEIEEALPVEKRLLETESGENFAEKLTTALGGRETTH